MKKIVFLLLSILGHNEINGQSKSFAGVRLGSQYSSAYIEHSIFPINLKTGFIRNQHAGVFYRYYNFKRKNGNAPVDFGLQLGVNYIQRGWKQIFEDGSGIKPYQATLSYLEVPVEGLVYHGKKNTKLYLTIGVYYERLLYVKLDNSPEESLLEKVSDEFHTYEPERDRSNGYGIRSSLGLQNKFPFGTLHIEAFTSVSFSGFIDYGNRTTRLPDQSNLFGIGLSIGYSIGWGKLDF